MKISKIQQYMVLAIVAILSLIFVYYQFVLKRFARSAKKILTVSEFSRRELSDWLELGSEKIQVVYNAIDARLGKPVSEADLEKVMKKYGLTKGGYFFCLSNPKPHKNVELLVRAFQNFRKENTEIPLVLSMTEFSESPGVRALGGFSDEETHLLLAGAKALFFPSLYEGFGLPPVEAAVMGVPVVVSSIEAHREALQDLAPDEVRWVDPLDLNSWTQTMIQAGRGELSPVRHTSRQAILTRYAVTRLGTEMNAIYRDALA